MIYLEGMSIALLSLVLPQMLIVMFYKTFGSHFLRALPERCISSVLKVLRLHAKGRLATLHLAVDVCKTKNLHTINTLTGMLFPGATMYDNLTLAAAQLESMVYRDLRGLSPYAKHHQHFRGRR